MTQTPRIPPSLTVPELTPRHGAFVQALRANTEVDDLRELMRLRIARTLDCFG